MDHSSVGDSVINHLTGWDGGSGFLGLYHQIAEVCRKRMRQMHEVTMDIPSLYDFLYLRRRHTTQRVMSRMRTTSNNTRPPPAALTGTSRALPVSSVEFKPDDTAVGGPELFEPVVVGSVVVPLAVGSVVVPLAVGSVLLVVVVVVAGSVLLAVGSVVVVVVAGGSVLLAVGSVVIGGPEAVVVGDWSDGEVGGGVVVEGVGGFVPPSHNDDEVAPVDSVHQTPHIYT